MIFDETNNLHRYAIPYADDVKKFLDRADLITLTQPEIELRGRDLFVRLMRYLPKPSDQNKFETHRCYADIQVIIQGREIMQVAPTAELQPSTDYDAANDYQFFNVNRNISDVIVNENSFAIFFPGEAHRPSCLVAEGDTQVFKLVFKVRMSKL